jgi:hypothetical protein
MLAAELKTEPESRKRVVGKQHEIEEQLARDKNGRAVFFVNFPLTPMYISPDAVEQDPESDLFIIRPGFEHAIPEGLIPDAKVKNTEQLSTVLGRVLSLSKLEKNPVIIFYVEDRKNVDDHQFKTFISQHDNFKLINITKDEYDEYKAKKISEATYAYHDENDQPIRSCIFATQIINPNLPSDWQILEGQDTQATITHLNELLKRHHQEPIHRVSISLLPATSLFAPLPVNEATNTSLPTTETCRSSSCTFPK